MRSFLPFHLKISFILFLVLFFTVSCSEKKQIVFDSSEPLALAPDVQWAVVVEPYAAFRKTTDWASEINGHCRKGDILQIKGNAVFNNSENWYYFDGGWLPVSVLDIYSNRYKAESAAGLLK